MKRDKDTDYTRVHDLTIEEVKACPTFQHFTDDDAKEVIETLKLFTKIAYDVYKKEAQHAEKSPKNRILKAQ